MEILHLLHSCPLAALQAARVEALQIRNSPTDSRTAAEEVSAMRVYLSRRDPSLSHMLAQVMEPQRRVPFFIPA